MAIIERTYDRPTALVLSVRKADPADQYDYLVVCIEDGPAVLVESDSYEDAHHFAKTWADPRNGDVIVHTTG